MSVSFLLAPPSPPLTSHSHLSLSLPPLSSSSSLLQLMVENRLDWIIDLIARELKRRIKDDDMPEAVLQSIDETVDGILPDIKMEVFTKAGEVGLSVSLSLCLSVSLYLFVSVSKQSPPLQIHTAVPSVTCRQDCGGQR